MAAAAACDTSSSTTDDTKIAREWSDALDGVQDELVKHKERKHTMQRVLHIVKSVEQRMVAPPLPSASTTSPASSSSAKTCSAPSRSAQSRQAIKDMCLNFARTTEQQMQQINGCLSKVTEAVEKLEQRKQEVVRKKSHKHSTAASEASARMPERSRTTAAQSIRQLAKLRELLKQARIEHQKQRNMNMVLSQQMAGGRT